jgi:hypothetical protein
MVGAGRSQRTEFGCIQPDIGLGIKLDIIAVNEQEGLVVFMIAQDLAQIGEGLTQVLAGAFVGLFGPQQGSQAFAAVGAGVFDNQVSKQGTDFIGRKVHSVIGEARLFTNVT